MSSSVSSGKPKGTVESDIHSIRSSQSKDTCEPKADRDDDDTMSVRSTRSTRSSVTSSSSLVSRSTSRGALTVATSVISLRDLETRKTEIEQELQRVQQELEARQTQERRRHAERPLALLPATVRPSLNTEPTTGRRAQTGTMQAPR